MDEELKKSVLEIGEVVKNLPSTLEEKAFEMLLAHELQSIKKLRVGTGETAKHSDIGIDEHENGNEPEQDSRGGRELKQSDVHLKVRKFLERNSLNLQQLSQLFYVEGDEVKVLYEDLKTTRTSEAQMRISVLFALKNAILSGEFKFGIEDVRQECQVRKSYDGGNFVANFKNNARLFENFDKNSTTLQLSEQGRVVLAEVVTDLSS